MITSKELAKICNVSRGTVDRALNDKPGISAKTRIRILEMADHHGYKPNILARNLVKGRTMCLGVVVFDLNNTFFAQLLNDIEAKAREKGYFLYITLTGKSAELEKDCLNHFSGRQVDGVILSSVYPADGYADFLNSLGIPVLTLLNKVDDSLPFIGMNDYCAMFDSTKYVLSNGYRRLIYVSPPLSQEGKANIYAQKRRFEGFMSAVGGHEGELEVKVISNKGYVDELTQYTFSYENKTAIICSSDYFAINTLNSFKTRGINVPFDVGVMGFDSISILKLFDPTLSTVATSIDSMASLAVEYMLDMIEKRDVPLETNMEYKIVPGQSIA